MAKFLALANLVLEHRNFPETIDKTLGDLIIAKLDRSLSLFTRTVLFPGVGEEKRKAVLTEMHDYYRRVMLKYSPTPGTTRNHIIFNDPTTFVVNKQNSNPSLFKNTELPIFERSQITNPQVDDITDFQKSLEGKGELNDVVVDALRKLEDLKKRSRE